MYQPRNQPLQIILIVFLVLIMLGLLQVLLRHFSTMYFSVYKLLESYELDAVSLIETTLKSLGLSSEWKALKNPKLHADYALYSPNPFSNMARKTLVSGKVQICI